MKKEAKTIKAIICKTDGKRERIEFTEKDSLETLQKLVGGLIEVVFLIGKIDEEEQNYERGRDLIINEEGLLLELPANPWSRMITEGTRWQGQTFFGDVVLINGTLR